MSEWRTDDPPAEKGGMILAYDEDGDEEDAPESMYKLLIFDGDYWRIHIDGMYTHGFSHWRTLPAPPVKAGKSGE